MENSSADQSAPRRRARLGAVNPLTVAVGIVLLCAGGAFGWRMRSDAPTARPTPEAVAAALELERVQGRLMCQPGGAADLRDELLRTDSEEPPARLAEHLPKGSPLPGYDRVETRAMDPSVDTGFLDGAVDGHVATYRPQGEGGFDVYAFRFLTRRAAADAVTANVVRRVCGLDGVPLRARGHPGMLVVEQRGPGGAASAWWVARGDVLVVEYAGWGDGKTSLPNVAAIAGAAAFY